MAQQRSLQIVVAVDFGTTFSSLAWALSNTYREEEIVQWWGNGVKTGEAVPTLLQYSGFTHRWGFDVDPEDEDLGRVYEWFKLGLYPTHSESPLASKYPSRNATLNEQACRGLVVDYLRALRQNFDNFKLRKGEAFRDVPTRYIITVPAIWTDRAKDITRTCAAEAGMGQKSSIQIIKEPEAAGIYALDSMANLGLQDGDTFVLCDAGGGTVDLISYTVTALQPRPRIIEAAQGSGGLCGGTFLNRIFERWLDEKFQNYSYFDSDLKSHVMRRFEEDIKTTFVNDPNRIHKISMRTANGPADDPRVNIKRGYLEIPRADLHRMFKEVIDEIIKLVRAQIQATRGRVKCVLLAGGFGQSDYLRAQLARALRNNGESIEVRPIKNGATAIVRGALMRGLTSENKLLAYGRSEGRIPTRSYGVPKWIDFDLRKGHDPSKKKYDYYRRKELIEVLDWFIEQGRVVMESENQHVGLSSRQDCDEVPFRPMDIVIYSHESRNREAPPQYVGGADMRELVKLKAKLDRIPTSKLRRDGDQYVADFDIETSLNSANLLTFTLKHAGTTYGEESVGTEFV